ncbi:MAG: glycosyl transferase family 1, partial [Chloroflexi bacterium]|nr:glycosyl transferase family 1 [Chloroflexota bacterium]
MLKRVATAPMSLEAYRGIISDELYVRIIELAEDLVGLRVGHINATPEGGGVAEMLKSLIPLKQGLGLDAAWYVMPPDEEFFKVTKQFHNCLQGKNGSLPPADFARYLRHNALTANLMKEIEVDVWVIHDPQPLATPFFLDDFHPVIWRCHIDTSTPNPEVRDFILPFIRYYDQIIF